MRNCRRNGHKGKLGARSARQSKRESQCRVLSALTPPWGLNVDRPRSTHLSKLVVGRDLGGVDEGSDRDNSAGAGMVGDEAESGIRIFMYRSV